MNVLLFLAGLAALVAGATLLVRGASKLALALGISPLVVGLTIVAFGTSAPEVAVSVGAALEGRRRRSIPAALFTRRRGRSRRTLCSSVTAAQSSSTPGNTTS